LRGNYAHDYALTKGNVLIYAFLRKLVRWEVLKPTLWLWKMDKLKFGKFILRELVEFLV